MAALHPNLQSAREPAQAPATPWPAPEALTIEFVRTTDRFADLGREWNALHEIAIGASVFNAWFLLFEWWRAYGEGRSLCIVVARSGGKLCGILPLYVEQQRALHIPVRVARLLGAGADTYPDDLGPLVHPGEGGVLERLVEAALEETRCDVALLEDLDGRIALPSLMTDAFERQAWSAFCDPAQAIAYIELPVGWDAFLRSASAKQRTQIRYLRNRTSRLGARFLVWDDAAGLDAAFERLATLHRKRWQAAERESTSFRSTPYLAFHRSAMKSALPRGMLRLYALEIGGELVAMLYAYRFRRTIFVMQAGFDPAWAKERVGQVLLSHALEHAIAEGNEIFDFLRGEHMYKDRLATGYRKTLTITALRRSVGAYAWKCAHRTLPSLKRLAKRARPLTSDD